MNWQIAPKIDEILKKGGASPALIGLTPLN